MGTISIVQRNNLAPTVARDVVPPEEQHRYTVDELTATRRRYFPAEGEPLELFEMTVAPDSETRPHAHPVPEIIFVTEGELLFGARVCAAGTAVFVSANTLYGFRAGPAGASFLNFRGTPCAEFILKEDFLASRSSGPPEDG